MTYNKEISDKATLSVAIVLAVVLFATGIIIAVVLGASIYKESDMKHWSQTSAKISSSYVQQFSPSQFIPEVSYQYEVNNKVYNGNKISNIPSDFKDKNEAQNFLKSYPVNKTIQIFYNPNNFSESTIDNTINTKVTFAIYVSLALIFLGLWMFFRAKKVMRLKLSLDKPTT